MYFSINKSKNIYIQTTEKTDDPHSGAGATYLHATCQANDGSWVENSTRLDDKIWYDPDHKRWTLGNPDWEGWWTTLPDGQPPPLLIDQVKPGTLQLKGGNLLTATLTQEYGGKDMAICLDFFFSNNDGKLEYDGLMVRYKCRDEALLRGFVIGRDGKLHYQEIDLGDHYENDNGRIKQKRNGNFFMTSDGWLVNSEFELQAHLEYKNLGGGWITAKYPLYKDIKVADDGSLSIDDPDDYPFFSLHGAFFRFLEDIPVLGYFIAGIDHLAGEYRAPLPAEPWVDPRELLSGQQLLHWLPHIALMADTFLFHGAGSTIGMIGSAFGELLAEELAAEGFDKLFSTIGGWLGKKGFKKLTTKEMQKIVDTIIDAMGKGESEDTVQAKIRAFDQELREKYAYALSSVVRDACAAVEGSVQTAIEDVEQEIKSQIQLPDFLEDVAQKLRQAVEETLADALQQLASKAKMEGIEDYERSRDPRTVQGSYTFEVWDAREKVVAKVPEAVHEAIPDVAQQVAAEVAVEKTVEKAVENTVGRVRDLARSAISDAISELRSVRLSADDLEYADLNFDIHKDVEDAVQKSVDQAQNRVVEAAKAAAEAVQAKAQKLLQEALPEAEKNAVQKIEQDIQKRMDDAREDGFMYGFGGVRELPMSPADLALKDLEKGREAREKWGKLCDEVVKKVNQAVKEAAEKALQEVRQEVIKEAEGKFDMALQKMSNEAEEENFDKVAQAHAYDEVKKLGEKIGQCAVKKLNDAAEQIVKQIIQQALHETWVPPYLLPCAAQEDARTIVRETEPKIKMVVQDTIESEKDKATSKRIQRKNAPGERHNPFDKGFPHPHKPTGIHPRF
ncbi:hypothetical protein GB937_009744 [Aspergillus fischeri]|nr:hypothetical protein GB937_009744 [Aspergillus fischeri]